ncbi:hypothetical protein ACFZAU_36195 [Streptomyces sp. NPDC008238]
MRSGTVGINGYVPDLASPYGGVKAGGLGSELGPEGTGGVPTVPVGLPAVTPGARRRGSRRPGDRHPLDR